MPTYVLLGLVALACNGCNPNAQTMDQRKGAALGATASPSSGGAPTTINPAAQPASAPQQPPAAAAPAVGASPLATDAQGQASAPADFHIKMGTGTAAWNDPTTAIALSVGQDLQIYNDDNVVHWLHTNGAPFPHPAQGIVPGGSAIYRGATAFTAGPLRDHLTLGTVYIGAR